jgi:hypothetical protein
VLAAREGDGVRRDGEWVGGTGNESRMRRLAGGPRRIRDATPVDPLDEPADGRATTAMVAGSRGGVGGSGGGEREM